MRRALVIAVPALLLWGATACSGSDEPAVPARSDDSTGTVGSGTQPVTSESTLAEGCEAETHLTVATDDGPMELTAATSYADIVGTDSQSGTFTFSNAAISVDDARSLQQPTGLADDEVVVIISIQGAGEVTMGTYPPRDLAETEAKIALYNVYDSSGRLFGDEPVVTLTHADEATVCGTLSSDSTKPGTVTGTFTAQRIDSGATRIR